MGKIAGSSKAKAGGGKEQASSSRYAAARCLTHPTVLTPRSARTASSWEAAARSSSATCFARSTRK